MNNNQIIKMARLCELLKSRRGLSSDEIQSILQISRRTFFNYLEELRCLGAEISYNKSLNEYKIENSFDLLGYCSNRFV